MSITLKLTAEVCDMSSSLVCHFADEKATTFARRRILRHIGFPLVDPSSIVPFSVQVHDIKSYKCPLKKLPQFFLLHQKYIYLCRGKHDNGVVWEGPSGGRSCECIEDGDQLCQESLKKKCKKISFSSQFFLLPKHLIKGQKAPWHFNMMKTNIYQLFLGFRWFPQAELDNSFKFYQHSCS